MKKTIIERSIDILRDFYQDRVMRTLFIFMLLLGPAGYIVNPKIFDVNAVVALLCLPLFSFGFAFVMCLLTEN